jgi:hypothetical protein
VLGAGALKVALLESTFCAAGILTVC